MKLTKNDVYSMQLPPAVIIKNFIHGHPADPEEFLVDFINQSKLVVDNNNEPFLHRSHFQQSNGQCDIYNSTYELDFKFIVDAKYMEARRLLSNQITEICPGAIITSGPAINGKQTTVNIFNIIRNKYKDDFINTKALKEDQKIIKVLNKLAELFSVNKNILYFLPFNLYFKNTHASNDTIKFIINCLSDDFQGLLEYRKSITKHDTYISFISEKYFVITKELHGKLMLYDFIPTEFNEKYTFLYNLDKF